MTNLLVTPIDNPKINFPLGLTISVTSDTTLSIATGACMDSNYTQMLYVDSVLTIDSAVVGAGGLDTGTIAQGIYAVYLINDSTGKLSINTLMSSSFTTPTVPYGYDIYRRIGLAIVDSSSHFVVLIETGSGNERTYWYDSTVQVFAGTSSATFAPLDLTGLVPTKPCVASFVVKFAADTGGDAFSLRTGGSSSATGTLEIVVDTTADSQTTQITIPVGLETITGTVSPAIDYMSTSASDSFIIDIVSFTDNIE